MADKALTSIYELAQKTGVSPSTVSRVLNQRGRIATATRKKILMTAREAGFRPKMTARSTTVGVVIDRHRYATFGGFVACVLSHLVQVLSGPDIAVELFTEQNINRIPERLIDGFLVLAWDDTTIDTLRRVRNVPVVTLNRVDIPEFSAVATDHRADGVAIVDYLADRGHHRIAMIAEEQTNWGARERVAGFTSRLRERNLDVDDQLIAYTQHQPMYGLIHRLLAAKPSAFFFAAEHLALEAAYILKDMLHLSIPQDVSIVGMESPQVSQYLSPPLTTIRQPLDELCAVGLQLLLKQIQTGDLAPQHILLHNQIIERESVADFPPKSSAT